MSREREITVDGARLHVHEWGPDDAPRVVMLHGALSSKRSMLGMVAALKGEYRCIAVDQRGHGKSTRFGTPANPWDRFTMPQLVADARVLADRLEPDAWVGVSMGGIVAGHVAATSPGDVRALALVSTAPGPSPRREAFFAGIGPTSFDAETRRLFDAWHGADYWPALAEAVGERFRSRSPEDYPNGALSAYRGPALVLQGDEDELIAPREADQWREWMPHADVRLLPGGHAFFAQDGRRETNHALKEFLARSLG